MTETAKEQPKERARYLVTVQPGAQVKGLAFVRAGDSFTAPTDDYEPSRTFRALNQPASDALKKLREKIKAHYEEVERRKKQGAGDTSVKPWDGVNDEVYFPPKEEPAIQHGTVPVDDLGRIDADRGRAQQLDAGDGKGKPATGVGKRTADG